MELEEKKKSLTEIIRKACEKRLSGVDNLEKEIENYSTRLLGILEKSPHLSVELLEKRLIDGIEANKIPVKHSKGIDAEILSVGESAEAGMNAPKKVVFADKEGIERTGFLKTNVIPYFNDAAFAMEEIGNLLDIKMAKNYEYNIPGKQPSIISENIADPNKGEEFVSMNKYMKGTASLAEAKEYFKENIEGIERGIIPEFYANKGRVISAEAISVLVDLPINAINEKVTNEEERAAFKDEYIKMLCFDFITNQTDRHDKNYGILLTSGENGIKTEFAPIFDSDYILHDASYPDKNDMAFNMSEKVDRKVLMQVVTEKYPEEVKAFQERLNVNEEQIYSIIQENFSGQKIEGIFTGKKDGRSLSIIDVYMDLVKENIKDFHEIVHQVQSKSVDFENQEGYQENSTERVKHSIDGKDVRKIAKMDVVIAEKENAMEARSKCERSLELDTLEKE